MLPFYVTREQLKLTGNIAGPSENARIDRLIAARTDSFQRWLGRHFYPLHETRSLDWPAPDQTPYSILLDADLLELETLTSAGVVINDFFPYPESGPPFSRIEIDLNSGESFRGGETWQRSIAATGFWGYSRDLAVAGLLVGGINDVVVSLDLSDSSLAGTGDLLKIDDEYLAVSRLSLKDTTATLSGDVDGELNVKIVPVDSGAKVHAGELITIDAERLLVEDVAGDSLICTRNQDASLIAAHTMGTHIYAPRTLTVERASVGSTAAAHLDAAPISRNVPPGLVTELCVAEVLAAREQELHGYGREIGQGDGAFELRGIGLADLRKRVAAAYQRRGGSRLQAV